MKVVIRYFLLDFLSFFVKIEVSEFHYYLATCSLMKNSTQGKYLVKG